MPRGAVVGQGEWVEALANLSLKEWVGAHPSASGLSVRLRAGAAPPRRRGWRVAGWRVAAQRCPAPLCL